MKLTCKAPNCGKAFEAKRPNAKTCSPTCRKRLQRAPVVREADDTGGEVVTLYRTSASDARGGVYTSTLAALEHAERVDTPLGQNLLVLAHRLDGSQMETGAGLAALEKSFRAAYAEAMAGADKDEDELDAIQRDAFTVISGGRV